MATTLAVIWFASAIGGAAAAIVGAAVPARRSRSLTVAAALFMVAGVLGILSIGIVFLVLAAVCAIAAGRSGRDRGLADDTDHQPGPAEI